MVSVILEWDELNPLYSVNVTVTSETQVNISDSTARLTVAYNCDVQYQCHIVSHPCGQGSVTIQILVSAVYMYLTVF